jgi:hypothetical protein
MLRRRGCSTPFYADIRALQGHAAILSELVTEGGDNPPQAEMQRHQAKVRNARRRAHVLVKRLRRQTFGAQTGILMDVHPVLFVKLKIRNLSFLGRDRMDNLQKTHI